MAILIRGLLKSGSKWVENVKFTASFHARLPTQASVSSHVQNKPTNGDAPGKTYLGN